MLGRPTGAWFYIPNASFSCVHEESLPQQLPHHCSGLRATKIWQWPSLASALSPGRDIALTQSLPSLKPRIITNEAARCGPEVTVAMPVSPLRRPYQARQRR